MVYALTCCCADDVADVCNCFRPADDVETHFQTGFDDCVLASVGGASGPDLYTYINEPVDTSDDELSFMNSVNIGGGYYECTMRCSSGLTNIVTAWDEVATATLRVRARSFDSTASGLTESAAFQLSMSGSVPAGFSSTLTDSTGHLFFNSASDGQCTGTGWITYEVSLDLYRRNPPPGQWLYGSRNPSDWLNHNMGVTLLATKICTAQISAVEVCLTGCLFDITGENPLELPECNLDE